MSEQPTTTAGRALLASRGRSPGWRDFERQIIAIEAEAVAPWREALDWVAASMSAAYSYEDSDNQPMNDITPARWHAALLRALLVGTPVAASEEER